MYPGITQLYYDLVDLDREQQTQKLNKLKLQNPQLHSRLIALLHPDPDSSLSRIIGVNAAAIESQADELDLKGQEVGPYQLEQELGRGGMGVVYQANRADDTFEQQVAIKLIKPSMSRVLSPDVLYMEAQMLAQLNHPYIAKVFDGGQHNELIYIAMEQVAGKNLSDYLATVSLPLNQLLLLFSKICAAIEHAHNNSLLHADIKPENILIDEDGSPKVVDFNIFQKVASGLDFPTSGIVAFSEKFASPEQQKLQHLTTQSDVFSLGKLLKFMIDEREVDNDVTAIVQKATQPIAAHRYASVASLMSDVQAVRGNKPISLRADNRLYVLKKLIQRRPFNTAATVASACTVMLFSLLLIQTNHQLRTEKAVAEDMVFEVTQLLYHSKGIENNHQSFNGMLELTRRRLLANTELPRELKQRMLLAMMTPLPPQASTPKAPSTATQKDKK